MMKRRLIVSAMATALSLSAEFALAADPEPTKEQAQTQKQEEIYGSQLMTPQERADHRAKMRAAKTAEEREKIRKEQHKLMQERAKARGLALPDEPLLWVAAWVPVVVWDQEVAAWDLVGVAATN